MSVTFAALNNQRFRWLFCGNAAMFFAIASRMMLTTLLAWQLTGEETSLALVNLALAIPMFTGALIGGAVVDRLERRRLILAGLTLLVLAEGSVLFALWQNALTFQHLLLVTFFCGSAHPFIVPATTTVMYNLLGRESMANGVALMSSAMNLSRVLGPALIGIVIATRNVAEAFTIVVGLNLIALFCQWHIPTCRPVVTQQKSLGGDIVQGLRYLFAERALILCLVFGLLPVMLVMSTQYMLVVFVDQVWQVGEQGLGLLYSAMGLGGFAGAMAIAKWSGRRRVPAARGSGRGGGGRTTCRRCRPRG